MKLVGLSRQIALSMMAMALGVTLLVFVTSFTFYYLWAKYWPEPFAEMGLLPSGPEWVWMIATTLVGLLLAVAVAVRLSRRILAPLNSVTEGIRRLAQGDLSVRAEANDQSLGEAAQLASDFNALANTLQRMTEEQAFWNAAIAHELRTPVTILRGRLQGLAEGVFSPDAGQFHSLLLQVEGLGRLIEDLRVVSLAEGGHLDLDIQPVDLGAHIRSVADFVSPSLLQAGQHLSLELGLQEAYCDPTRIRQLLLALLENVRKHALPGAVQIRSYQDAGGYHLSVTDQGPGIPASLGDTLFTAFRRAPQARSSGSGLGLAVVAAIAHAHAGQVSFHATAQGGTTFELSWPAPLA